MAETPTPLNPEHCAVCGADIPHRARACPECGADEKTGWRESDLYDGLDLPDSAWDEDEGSSRARRQIARDPETGLPWYWIAVALVLVIGGILYALGLL